MKRNRVDIEQKTMRNESQCRLQTINRDKKVSLYSITYIFHFALQMSNENGIASHS